MIQTDVVKNSDFDALKTILVAETDSDLLNIILDEVKMDVKLLKTVITQGLLSEETDQFLRSIFLMIIHPKKDLMGKYLTITESQPQSVLIEGKKEKAIPRRFGKEKLLEEIKNQNGKATEVQRMLLSTNDLKNIYVNLNNRGIKHIHGINTLSDEDCRNIIATIDMVKKKLGPILKKSK